MLRKTAKATALVLLAAALFGAGWFVGATCGPWDDAPWSRLQQLSWLTGWLDRGDEWEQAPSFAPVRVASPGEASLLFVGDLLPLQDRDYLTHASALIASADLAVGNLECPLSTHGRRAPLKLDERGRVLRNEYLFRAPPSQAQRLADAGFDALTLANNHTMDFGGEALVETLGQLDAAGIRHTGAGPDRAVARAPVICQVAGQTIALLAYASVRTLPGTDGFAATDELAGTVFVGGSAEGEPTQTTREMLRNDVRAAGRRADFVVVAFHWGREGTDAPDPLQRRLAHLCIDAGADLVVGHHPHKLHGVEIYQGRPIAYSLGNFAFPTPWESNHFSAALEVHIEGGQWRELIFHPVRLRFRAGDPAPAEGADRQQIVRRVTTLSEQLGTACVYDESGGDARIIIRNPSATRARTTLLRAEEQRFFAEPHPELDGMSTVHFLAWDLQGSEKVSMQRTVVVLTALAPEVLEIFREIYLSPEQFPIHEVIGYDYRTVAGGGGRLSNHALGRAIDINRAENPMIQGGKKIVHPDEPPYVPGEWRPGEDPCSITPDGSVVTAFKRRGWHWGGEWTSCKDYQHFDKPGG